MTQYRGRDGGDNNISELLIATARRAQRGGQEFTSNPSNPRMMLRAARRNAPSLMHGRYGGRLVKTFQKLFKLSLLQQFIGISRGVAGIKIFGVGKIIKVAADLLAGMKENK